MTPFALVRLRGEDSELLSDRRIGIVGIPRLSFAHHVDHLDTGQHNGRGRLRLEAEHGPDAALDAPMILLNTIVQVLALSYTRMRLNQKYTQPRIRS